MWCETEPTSVRGCAAADSHDPSRGAWRRTHGLTVLACVGLAAVSCATPEPPSVDAQVAEAPEPIVLTAQGEEYLKNAFQFGCAAEYILYPDGEGPPVPQRTDAQRSERQEELTSCLETVKTNYATPEGVRLTTWNGKKHSMSDAEMQAVVRYGDAFLDDYVRDLLEGEKQREGRSTDRIAPPPPKTP
jgi:hypothetical protein